MPQPTIEGKTLFGEKLLKVSYPGSKKTILIVDNSFRLVDEIPRNTFCNIAHYVCRNLRMPCTFLYTAVTSTPKKTISKLVAKTRPDIVVMVDETLTSAVSGGDYSSFGRIVRGEEYSYLSTVPFRYWADEAYKKGAAGPNLLGFTLRHLIVAASGKPLYRPIKDYADRIRAVSVTTIKQFDAMMDKLDASDLIAIDTEGDSLRRVTSKLFTLQFGIKEGDKYRCYVMPWEHRETPWTSKDFVHIKKRLRAHFRRSDVEHIYHTADFDVGQFMTHLGMKFYAPKIYDIAQGEFLLDENAKFLRNIYGQKAFALEFLEKRYGIERPVQTVSKEDRKNMAKFTLKELFEYAAWDVLTLHIIRDYQLQQCTNQLFGYTSVENYKKVVWHQLGITLKTFSTLQNNGIAIDVAHVVSLARQDGIFGKTIEELYDKLMMTENGQKANQRILKMRGVAGSGLFGKKDDKPKRVFSLSKAEHLRILYFDIMKLEPVRTSAAGNHSVDKAFQTKYAARHPEVAILREFNQNNKLKSAFADAMAKKVANDKDFQYDGRIRPSFGNLGVLTGRLACLVGETWVSVADERGLVQIKDVKVGDSVYTLNEKTSKVEAKLVNKLLQQGDYYVLNVTFESGTVVSCTKDHRFGLTAGGWKKAKELVPGDTIRTLAGNLEVVRSVDDPDLCVDTFDLEVEGNHNFFANGVLVHNCYDPNAQQIPSRGPLAKPIKRMFIAGVRKIIRDRKEILKRRVMLASDFSAHEIRMSGSIAKDPVIIDTFSGAAEHIRKYRIGPIPNDLKTTLDLLDELIDVHLANVQRFYNLKVTKDHPLRNRIKSVVFSSIYGAEAPKIAKETMASEVQGAIDLAYKVNKILQVLEHEDMKVILAQKEFADLAKEYAKFSEEGASLAKFLKKKKRETDEILSREYEHYLEQAEDAFQRLKDVWNVLFDWMRDTQKHASKTFQVHYPNGRIRHLYGYLSNDIWIHRAMDRRATNSVVQGVSSDIGITSIYTANEWCYRNCWSKGIDFDYVSMNVVHDANYNDVQFEHLPLGVYLLEHSMSTLPANYYRKHFDWDIGVPLGYDIDIGLNWAELKEWRKRPEQLYDMISELGEALGQESKFVIRDAKKIMDIRMKELEKGVTTPMFLNGDRFTDFASQLHMFQEAA